jgi:hypothetical protein
MRPIAALVSLGFVAVLCALGGCASPKDKPDLDGLRARSDKSFAEMDGRAPLSAGEKPRAESAKPAKASAADSAKAKAKPRWVDDADVSSYPRELHIVGVGSSAIGGDNIRTFADDRARAEVAKEIRVQINSEFTAVAEDYTRASKGKVETQSSSRVVEQIKSKVDIVLDGVTIADRWVDPATGMNWSLAVLDRKATGEMIRDRMNQLLQDVRKDADMGREDRKAGRVFQGSRLLNQAVRKSMGLLSYRAQLRCIAKGLVADPSAGTEDEMSTLARDAAAATDAAKIGTIVFLEVSGAPAPAGTLEGDLSRALRDLGMNTVKVPPPPQASFTDLKGRTVAQIKEMVGGRLNGALIAQFATKETAAQKIGETMMHFCRARAEGMLVDLDTGRIVASPSFDWSAKSHNGDRDVGRAGEAALAAGVGEFIERLRAELGDGK